MGSGLKMANDDIKNWTLVGLLIGMITSGIVNPAYSLVGVVIGGFIGYILGRSV